MTTQRFEIPRMTTVERDALTNVKAGTIIVNSDVDRIQFSPYDDGLFWEDVADLNDITNITLPYNYVNGFGVQFDSATTLTLEAGICVDSQNQYNISMIGVNVLVDATNVGVVNGLDTGTVAANNWYYVHAISSLDGTLVGGLLSLSATAPTLPSGYDIFRRVGAARYQSAGFLQFISAGSGSNKEYFYNGDTGLTRFLGSGTATVRTSVSCSAFVPPTAQNNVVMGVRVTPVSSSFVYLIDTGNPLSISATNYRSLAIVPGLQLAQAYDVVISESKSVDYVLSESGALVNLIIVGFTDKI